MRRVYVKASEKHARMLRCDVMRGKKLPFTGERVVLETTDGQVLKANVGVDRLLRKFKVRQIQNWRGNDGKQTK